MKTHHFLLMTVMSLCACKKNLLSAPGQDDPRTRKQIAGTVLANTSYCINPWLDKYPTIIRLDIPIDQHFYVFTTDLADSFLIPGAKIRFDLEFARDPRRNWCDGMPLPDEALLSNVKFD